MGSYKRNRFVDIQVGDKVNLKTYCMGKYTMVPSVVTFVGNEVFSINNNLRTYSKDSGRAMPYNNSIITHYLERTWEKIQEYAQYTETIWYQRNGTNLSYCETHKDVYPRYKVN